MQVAQRVEHGPRPHNDLRRGKGVPPIIEQPGQVIALDELHDQELRPVLNEVVDDDRQRWVAQSRQELRLVLERAVSVDSREPALLDRDRVLQARVDRFVDGTHPTATDLANDPVSVVEHYAVDEHG